MKRLFTFIVAAIALAVTSVQAQQLQRSPLGIAARQQSHRAIINPGANQAWWGYVDNSTDKLGLGAGQAATYDCAIFIPGDHAVAGGKTIQAIRIGLVAPHVKAASVWVANSLTTNQTHIQQVEVPASELGAENIDVALDEPYAIPATGVYVGYTFTITSVATQQDYYPILTTGEDTPEGLYLKFGTYSWDNYYGEGYGSLFLQVLLEGEFADNQATPDNFGSVFTKIGESATAKVPFTNNGITPVSSIDYVITSNGVAGTEQHVELDEAVDFGLKGAFNITVQSENEQGKLEKTLTITKTNGNANDATKKDASFTHYSLSEIIERNVAVEEFTGTGCGWCPRGMVGMQKLRQAFGDRFVGIAIHQYNQSDAMFIATTSYAKLGFTGAPSCTIDRKEIIDPYYGTADDIRDDFAAEMAIPSLAKVEVAGVLDADATKVDATAKVTALFDSEYKLEFVLIADDLSGTTTAWNQSNYYYQYSASQVEDDLAQFASGGKNGSSSIKGWHFDDVAIASSYVSGVNKVAALTLTAGQEQETSYTLTLPTKATLKNALNNEKLYVIALLVDTDGTIVNAAKQQVDASATTAINALHTAGADVAPAAYFTIDGRQLSAPQRGVNLVRMTDGTVQKVIVK